MQPPAHSSEGNMQGIAPGTTAPDKNPAANQEPIPPQQAEHAHKEGDVAPQPQKNGASTNPATDETDTTEKTSLQGGKRPHSATVSPPPSKRRELTLPPD
ncbi:hypothetical protein K470DRAFT_270530 [Piedraia hortae CBS 480.64]|uniref:Uncharacterized protein n=1 Tax=Piedraia hortae CBS 480.64 TaxID=1314780 RepID=A0A6A7C1X1_9PEZI|nr:hypothetical protein K470DRAFT_270530 [Piedraia hortae CBS 480.64]